MIPRGNQEVKGKKKASIIFSGKRLGLKCTRNSLSCITSQLCLGFLIFKMV